KDGIYHVRFRYRDREYKRSLKIRDKGAAEAARNLVELTIHRLLTGQVVVPARVGAGDFIVSGGTLMAPVRSPDPVANAPSTNALIEEYKEGQKNLLAESYHYSQALHLRHF